VVLAEEVRLGTVVPSMTLLVVVQAAVAVSPIVGEPCSILVWREASPLAR
jgi:hypothetical protein